MERFVMNEFIRWKNAARRRPLLVQGARQVGKTWLIKEFGNANFREVAYINFLGNQPMQQLFEGSLTPGRLLEGITAYTGVSASGSDTLVVLDEIQECPRALMSLKAFAEDAPQVPVVAAGSLLGVALHKDVSFPVGKVDHLFMHPMTFDEFLLAVGDGALRDLLHKADFSLTDALRERYEDRLRQYYYVGGMPEAVAEFAESGSFEAVRTIQNRLLFDYEHDFSKYADALLAEKIRLVWNSVPSQLARENKKFIFSAVREGARARGYEEAIQWLVDAGLLLRVKRVSKAALPLSLYEDRDAFKLYFFDVGLLGAANRLSAKVLVEGSRLFQEFKGALSENYVCQELVATNKVVPYYWAAQNSSGEVDFVYDYEASIVPVEVKATVNLKAKSLKMFVEKNHLGRGLRLSLEGFREQDWVVNLPLYAAGLLPEWYERLTAAQNE